MKTTLTIGTVTFDCLVDQLDALRWVAVVTSLSTNVDGRSESSTLQAEGSSPDEALAALRSKLKANFTLSVPDISLKQILLSLAAWIWASATFRQRFGRLAISLVGLLLVSPFFVNFATGDSTIAQNMRAAANIIPGGTPTYADRGFIDEDFIKRALREAKTRFWASGVSYRNMVAGNRDELIASLKRGVQVKIALLDPGPQSPLATDRFMTKFSRTAKNTDITKTIEALIGEAGILHQFGRKDRDQLWVADYAPIVPLVVKDDTIFVSFLLHVDPDRTMSNYGQPYLKVAATSPMGVALLKHFQNMLQSDGSYRKFPA
jgi:hypothetical protein